VLAPFGVTEPFNIAPNCVIEVAAVVATVGAFASGADDTWKFAVTDPCMVHPAATLPIFSPIPSKSSAPVCPAGSATLVVGLLLYGYQ
jgi:hypothetical protein